MFTNSELVILDSQDFNLRGIKFGAEIHYNLIHVKEHFVQK